MAIWPLEQISCKNNWKIENVVKRVAIPKRPFRNGLAFIISLNTAKGIEESPGGNKFLRVFALLLYNASPFQLWDMLCALGVLFGD